MTKTVAIIQSSYIPWKGYFDIMARSDEFVLLDEVQFTRRDWRNRNRIKTPQGLKWLTIPVQSKGRYEAPIETIRVSDPSWPEKHWQTLAHAYGRAPCFTACESFVRSLYETADVPLLSEVNHHFLTHIAAYLGIQTPIRWSHGFQTPEDPTGRLLAICQQTGSDRYLSGPSAKQYLDLERFRDAGITVEWMDYSNYPVYDQLYPPFEHGVSILDVLFHLGTAAPAYALPAADAQQGSSTRPDRADRPAHREDPR